ncbi:MAG: RNA ligase RtcB family protein, partial [Bryobacterales bacterium]|nr:RNA ligase RtcB family protein [Bryobacterales bacterium]
MGEQSKAEVRVIASPQNWIEGEAVRQLEKTASLEGMRLAVGLPDLHPGKGSPIGAAFAAEGWIYPTLVGNDIGCGVALFETDLRAKGAGRRESWAERLRGLEDADADDAAAFLEARGVAPAGFEVSLGTIGSGNHFAELQVVESVAPQAGEFGLDRDAVYLCVHSGSRGFGERILRGHVERFGAGGLQEGSEEAGVYLERHGHAMAWARANRERIAERMLGRLKAGGRRLLDVCHNFVERADVGGVHCWLHRKGAAPSTAGAVLIPGSRGAFSYLVRPREASEESAFSLAHGAGRKWSRS